MHHSHKPSPLQRASWGKKGLFFGFFFLVAITALGAVIMYLWNALLPHLFGVPEISYWEALGLFILCRLLFGGFHFGKHHKSYKEKAMLKEQFMHLSDEEKEAFKAKWKERCGHWKPKSE